MIKEFVEMRDVRKIYRMGEVEIAAADGIDFQIKKTGRRRIYKGDCETG